MSLIKNVLWSRFEMLYFLKGSLLIFFIRSAGGNCLPILLQHEEFPERVRTTGLSVMNLSTEAIFAISYFVSAPFIDVMSIKFAWGVSAVSFFVAALISAPVAAFQNSKAKLN